MTFDFRDFEFVSRHGVVILASAVRADAPAFRNRELLLAVMTFADGFDFLDLEDTIVDFLAIFDSSGPAFVHKARNDTRRFADRQSHFRNDGKMLLLHEVLKSSDQFYGIAKFVHESIPLEGIHSDLDAAFDGVACRFRKDRGEALAVNVRLFDEVCGVELAFDDALSAANAEVRVDDGTSTAKATGGFFLDLFLGQDAAVVLIGLGIDGTDGRNLTRGVVEAKLFFIEVINIDLLEVAKVAAGLEDLAGLYVAME